MRQRFWIVTIYCPKDIEQKIEVKHRVTLREVYEAVSLGNYLEARWDHHPAYGRRLMVKGKTADNVLLLVFLRLIDEADGVWELRTARRIEG